MASPSRRRKPAPFVFDPRRAHVLDHPERLAWFPPRTIARLLRLGPGSRLLDLGGGTGGRAPPPRPPLPRGAPPRGRSPAPWPRPASGTSGRPAWGRITTSSSPCA